MSGVIVLSLALICFIGWKQHKLNKRLKQYQRFCDLLWELSYDPER